MSFSFPGLGRVEVKMTVLSISIARRNAVHIVLKWKVLDRLPMCSPRFITWKENYSNPVDFYFIFVISRV